MNRSRANEIRRNVERAAIKQSDYEALESVWMYPEWKPDTAYTVGERIRYGENLFRCEQAHTSQEGWEPDAAVTRALWTPVSDEEWPEWVQPAGVQDAYAAGDKVTYGGKRWVSDISSNVWEPGVYGWTEVT